VAGAKGVKVWGNVWIILDFSVHLILIFFRSLLHVHTVHIMYNRYNSQNYTSSYTRSPSFHQKKSKMSRIVIRCALSLIALGLIYWILCISFQSTQRLRTSARLVEHGRNNYCSSEVWAQQGYWEKRPELAYRSFCHAFSYRFQGI
jgi:hypothetical protein